MDSVYKLSKYSQKIDEACRAKQLNKVMEYNKHELTYINKLSKYFGNQKGGATTVKEVVDAVEVVLGEVAGIVIRKDAKIDELSKFENQFIEQQTLHKQQLQNSDAERELLRDNYNKASSELERTRISMLESSQLLNSSREQLATANQKLATFQQLNEKFKEKEAENDSLKKEKQILNDEITGLKIINATRTNEIAQLDSQNKIIKAELARQAQGERTKTQGELTQTQAQSQKELAQAKSQVENFKTELSNAQSELAQVRTELVQLNHDIKAELATAQTQNAEIQVELNRVKEERDKAQAELAQVEQGLGISRGQLGDQVQKAQGSHDGSKRKK